MKCHTSYCDPKGNYQDNKSNCTNNKLKDQLKRKTEYEKLNNKKKDIRNKLVSVITKNYKYVCFQDESIHAWSMSNHGKKIQHSGIGGILSDLKHKSVTPIEVNKFFPSTQLCPICGNKHKLELSERTYLCDCGFTMDRDVKAAICIKEEALKQIPMEHRNFKPGEISSSTIFDLLSNISNVQVSKVESVSQEAAIL
jgi:transposase